MDDLDVRIASREFEEAVRSIEKGRQLLGTIDPKQQTYLLLSIHLSHRTQQLTNLLSHCLSLESRLPKSTKRYASLLFRLGEDDLAKSTYLQSRSEYVGRKIRAMQHPGAYGVNDVDGTVEGIAWLVVRIIKNSWSVYSETFTDTRMASSFFEWVKEQVEGFADLFRRQLYGYPQDSQVYLRSKERVEQVWSESRGLGLDMTFLLGTLISGSMDSERTLTPSASASAVEGVGGLGLENVRS